MALRLLAPLFVFTNTNTLTTPLKSWPLRQPVAFLILAVIVWLALYETLAPASEALVAALPVDQASHLGGALQFFFYDTPKVLMLLTGVVFVMGMINSYFTPERTRALLAGRTEGVANVMAARIKKTMGWRRGQDFRGAVKVFILLKTNGQEKRCSEAALF